VATESNLHQPSSGARTYRGRTLEEILPQIRSELGADAVILREREGLVGGVGGFFAQRFIEVEARRGDGQSIDIYDDEPGDDLRLRPRLFEPEPVGAEPKALLPPEPTEIGASRMALPPAPVSPDPQPFVPPPVERDPPAPPARRFETAVFMDRLREASAVLPDDDAFDMPATGTPAAEPEPEPAKPAAKPRAAARRKSAAKPNAKTQAKAEPVPQASAGWAAEIEAPPQVESDTANQRQLEPETPPEPTPLRAPSPKLPVSRRRPPAPVSEPEPPTPESPYEFVRRRPTIVPEPPLTPAPSPGPLPAPSKVSNGNANGHELATVPAPAPRDDERRESGPRTAFGRFIEGLRSTGPTRPAPAQPLDLVAATGVAKELSTRGASQAWTSQLISVAGAHGRPLAGDLRAAAEAEVARRILPAPPLPAGGAAIAFVGAGGSGKTRCTAALASAYRRASTLTVTVLALDNPDGARELRKLLRDDAVPVLSLSGGKARRAVQGAREGGLVIVDTGAATPTDPDAVQALRAQLEPLNLDAVYVTLPATLGSEAARRALASFGALQPSAVAITHADETDQLAVAVEIAVANHIPLAYFHSGTDHRNALSVVDPPAVAQQLLA
jgi:flagellar biosynthesis GTPase FlhF